MNETRCIWVAYFVSLAVVLCQAEHDFFRLFKRDDDTKVKFCGRLLANQLSSVCNGRYNTKWNYEKKSTHSATMGTAIDGAGAGAEGYWAWSEELNDAENALGSGLPWLPGRSRPGLRRRPVRHRPARRRRGIVEECCYTACSINELREYCYG